MELEQPQQHEMVLVATHDIGADEWYCPACGRRFLMQWPPDYKKIILAPGDESATHRGGKGGVSIQLPQVIVGSETDSTDESNLAIWEEWLGKVGFESWWNREI